MSWHNNRFNERVWNEIRKEDGAFPFSLEDIDGVIRFHYDEGKKTRLILFEVKSLEEKEIQPAQFKTLCFLEKVIKWKELDEYSGVFLIRGLDENFDKTIIKQIKNGECISEQEVSFDYYWKWFANISNFKCPNPRCNSTGFKEITGGYECLSCANGPYNKEQLQK